MFCLPPRKTDSERKKGRSARKILPCKIGGIEGTKRKRTCRRSRAGEVRQIRIFRGVRSGIGLAHSSIVAATDRDFKHPANIFAGICVIHGRNPDETLDSGSARMIKVFMSSCSSRSRIAPRTASSSNCRSPARIALLIKIVFSLFWFRFIQQNNQLVFAKTFDDRIQIPNRSFTDFSHINQ